VERRFGSPILIRSVLRSPIRGAESIGPNGAQRIRNVAATLLGPTVGTAVRTVDLGSQADRGDPMPLERAVLRDVVPSPRGPRLRQHLLPISRLRDHLPEPTRDILARYGVELTKKGGYGPDPAKPHFSPKYRHAA